MSYSNLATRAQALQNNYPDIKTEEDEAWEGSPFDWFRKKPSATKGKIGRDLVISIFQMAGFTVIQRGIALEVAGKLIRIKTSLMWNEGSFKFEQFRDTDYNFVFCLGLYPESAYGWLIPKDEVIQEGIMQDKEGLTPQHGGMSGTEDFWLGVNPSAVADWMNPYGGTIDFVVNVIKKSL